MMVLKSIKFKIILYKFYTHFFTLDIVVNSNYNEKTFLYRVATDLMFQSDRILKAFSLHFLYIRILEWRFLN